MKVELNQQADDWLSWRKSGIGGSDAGIVLGLSPWKSKYDLWAIKTGKKLEDPMNAAMKRGVDLEPEARMAFERMTGIDMKPACYQHDHYSWMRCSLDGISDNETQLLEIKCPGEANHNKALDGHVPDHYVAQMQHCMAVTGAEGCYYFSYRPESVGTEQAMIIVPRDEAYIKDLIEKESAFWAFVSSNTPPETDFTDYIYVDDEEALDAAQWVRECKERLDEAQQMFEDAKERLADYTDDGNAIIGPVRITRVTRAGSIDWRKMAKEHGIADSLVESYRKADTSYLKFTVSGS